jgi:uncharacterized protein
VEQSPAAVEVRKDETTHLYEALIDGRVVGNLAYETTGGRVTLTHSYVDPDQRHRGIASALAHYALEDVSQSPTKIGIYCGFVADYVQDHPEWNDTVDISRSAFIATRTARDVTSGRLRAERPARHRRTRAHRRSDPHLAILVCRGADLLVERQPLTSSGRTFGWRSA